MKIDFKGKIALVTGATRGIGKKIADDLATLGAELILTGTDIKQIEALNKMKNSSARYFCADFTDPCSMDSFLIELEKYKRIDVCINNAGINRIDYIDKTKTADWDKIAAVNLKAPFLIIRTLSKMMKKNRYGRIVNISSIFGSISKAKRSIYSATKFGIKGLTVAASNELAGYNILVNSVSPGFVLTDMTRSILSKKEMNELKRQVPAGRLATPEDISCVVLFLASNLNTYITGKDIIVDGGYTDV